VQFKNIFCPRITRILTIHIQGVIFFNFQELTTAPVRCFHLTAPVLSGEKHLTSAIGINLTILIQNL